MNKVILTGRITKDIDLRYTQDQKAIVRFSLAVDRRNKDKSADFISCVAWEKTAEFMSKYLAKGSKIGIVGRIQTGSYTDHDGNKVFTTDVIAEDVEFLEPKKEDKPKNDFVPFPDDVSDFGLPF